MQILAGGFAGLMVDIRLEHVEVVREHAIAWLPIIYAGFMAVAGNVAAFVWNKAARRVMLLFFLISFVIGGMGFYFHNHGNIKRVVKASVNAWIDPTMDHSDEPPQVAPLAFAGLAMLGILASLERFNTEGQAVPDIESIRLQLRRPVATFRSKQENGPEMGPRGDG